MWYEQTTLVAYNGQNIILYIALARSQESSSDGKNQFP